MTKLAVFHPTDLSAESSVAFAHAVRIALPGDSRLTALHVHNPDETVSWDDFPTAQELLERWDFIAAGSTAGAVAEMGIEVDELEAANYEPLNAIVDYLEQHPADLIVLATTGRQGFHRWFEGSVAESVARLSGVMSLFVPHDARGFVDVTDGSVSLDTVLVPVTRAPAPALAIRAARTLATALGVSAPKLRACFIGNPDDAPVIADDDVALMLRPGDVADGILAAAAEIEADLVVMATQGHNSMLDVLRGSTTERVLRGCPCPLLAIPSGP